MNVMDPIPQRRYFYIEEADNGYSLRDNSGNIFLVFSEIHEVFAHIEQEVAKEN